MFRLEVVLEAHLYAVELAIGAVHQAVEAIDVFNTDIDPRNRTPDQVGVDCPVVLRRGEASVLATSDLLDVVVTNTAIDQVRPQRVGPTVLDPDLAAILGDGPEAERVRYAIGHHGDRVAGGGNVPAVGTS